MIALPPLLFDGGIKSSFKTINVGTNEAAKALEYNPHRVLAVIFGNTNDAYQVGFGRTAGEAEGMSNFVWSGWVVLPIYGPEEFWVYSAGDTGPICVHEVYRA